MNIRQGALRTRLAFALLTALAALLPAAPTALAVDQIPTPVTYKREPNGNFTYMVGGKPQLDNIVAVFTNPVFLWGYGKVVLASVTTGTLVMLAVSAWQLRKGKDPKIFGHSLRLSLIVLVPAITLTLFVGDMLGVVEGTYQPMKIAAAEAQWTTCQPCSFSLFQIGGGNNDETPIQIISVPHLLSLLATNHWNGQVVGLNPLQQQYTKQYGPGNYVPNVFIQYWSMRIMAYLGALVLLSTFLYALAALAVAAQLFGAEGVLYSEHRGWFDFLRRRPHQRPK